MLVNICYCSTERIEYLGHHVRKASYGTKDDDL